MFLEIINICRRHTANIIRNPIEKFFLISKKFVNDSVFLNQDGDEVEAGKLIAKTVVTTTALSTFFEKIVALVKQQDVNIQSKMDKATGDAFKAAAAAFAAKQVGYGAARSEMN